ncbi:MAG: hypothetical protein ACK415_09745 [Thermodesulfovibrionales bacterium]
MMRVDNPMNREITETWHICKYCNGTGEVELCSICHANCDACKFLPLEVMPMLDCPRCDGIGYLVRYY